jgi:hypothetical protein
MLVYLDMDGVLVDLDGHIARQSGYSGNLLEDRNVREQLLAKERKDLGPAFPRLLPPNQIGEFKKLMHDLVFRGHRIEILTSYGDWGVGDLGVQSHQGKRDWLMDHYRTEVECGVISRFNGVQDCAQKVLFARPGSLLVDDQPENVQQFIESGGQALLYKSSEHHSAVAGIWRIV